MFAKMLGKARGVTRAVWALVTSLRLRGYGLECIPACAHDFQKDRVKC